MAVHQDTSTFTSASVSTALQSIIISASVIRSGSTHYSRVLLQIHRDLVVLAETPEVALAVGLDVLAISVGVGAAQVPRDASVRLEIAFASSEVTMQGARVGSLKSSPKIRRSGK